MCKVRQILKPYTAIVVNGKFVAFNFTFGSRVNINVLDCWMTESCKM